jgi:hypothetical protein
MEALTYLKLKDLHEKPLELFKVFATWETPNLLTVDFISPIADEETLPEANQNETSWLTNLKCLKLSDPAAVRSPFGVMVLQARPDIIELHVEIGGVSEHRAAGSHPACRVLAAAGSVSNIHLKHGNYEWDGGVYDYETPTWYIDEAQEILLPLKRLKALYLSLHSPEDWSWWREPCLAAFLQALVGSDPEDPFVCPELRELYITDIPCEIEDIRDLCAKRKLLLVTAKGCPGLPDFTAVNDGSVNAIFDDMDIVNLPYVISELYYQ